MDNIDVNNNNSIPLAQIQNFLKNQSVKALLVRSTDKYFNEYVPKAQSIRTKLTGFDGSVGDAIITTTDAHLFVDGRYSLQAKAQAKGYLVHVTKNAQSIESSWLSLLSGILKAGEILAYDPATIDLHLFDKMSAKLSEIGAKLDALAPSTLYQLAKINPAEWQVSSNVLLVGEDLAGLSCRAKLKTISHSLAGLGIDGYLAVKLDDIAYVTNLRSDFFPYQSTIPGLACLMPDRLIFAVANEMAIKGGLDSNIVLTTEAEFFQAINKEWGGRSFVLGVDENEVSKAHELALRKLNIEIKRVKNPIAPLKAQKNEKELLHLRSAFKKADVAVYRTQNFVIDCYENGHKLKESDVDFQIRAEFKRTAAKELSFRPICASGKNGAIIHYGSPSDQEVITEGSLFLLDTGAYYEGGYATDLTRTFLAAKKTEKAKPWQKEMFTLVLKASIAGLSARFRTGTVGMQLDAIVRAPLWQKGLDFAHGTGHGIGINVHEFPPRISPASTTPLLIGHVFSIEPGLYFEGLGGVRIENLATVVKDDEPDFLRILPLTFCPFDERLIEYNMLEKYEQEFLAYYQKEWSNEAAWPNLPPLSTVKFMA